MGSNCARGLAPDPGGAGGGGAIRESAADAADVARAGVVERAKGCVALPLDPVGADSGDVPEAPLDLGRSAILSARWV